MRTLLSSVSSFAFAAVAEHGAPKAADKVDEKAIDKVVYINAGGSLKALIANVENTADATLRLISAVVVHMIVRAYHPITRERLSWEDTREEILTTIKEHAAMKRGYDFQKAWVYRLIQNGRAMAVAMVKDFDVKGVQEGSPLNKVLRAKTAEKAADIVMDHIKIKTKGATSFAALELSLNPPKARGANGRNSGGGAGRTKGGNNVKVETVAAGIASDKGTEAINAVAAKTPVARARIVADKIASANVDHFTMVQRFIAMIEDPEKLMQVAELATTRAKELAKAKAAKPKRTKAASGQPEAVAASAS